MAPVAAASVALVWPTSLAPVVLMPPASLVADCVLLVSVLVVVEPLAPSVSPEEPVPTDSLVPVVGCVLLVELVPVEPLDPVPVVGCVVLVESVVVVDWAIATDPTNEAAATAAMMWVRRMRTLLLDGSCLNLGRRSMFPLKQR